MQKNTRLVWAREHARLTQAEAAELMGMARGTFNAWEQGRMAIPPRKFTLFLDLVNIRVEDHPELTPEEPSEDPPEDALGGTEPLAVAHPEGLRLSDPYWFTKQPGEHWMAAHERKLARTKLAWGFTEQLQDFVKYTVRPAGLYSAIWDTGFVTSKDANGNFDPELSLEKCEKWFEEHGLSDADMALA